MPRGIWITAALVAGTGIAALLISQPHASDGDMPLTVARPVPSRDVQVRHEFVRLPSTRPAPRVPRARQAIMSLAASAQGAAPAPIAARQARPTERALLSKVGRAVAGDGRFRPEPFPKLR